MSNVGETTAPSDTFPVTWRRIDCWLVWPYPLARWTWHNRHLWAKDRGNFLSQTPTFEAGGYILNVCFGWKEQRRREKYGRVIRSGDSFGYVYTKIPARWNNSALGGQGSQCFKWCLPSLNSPASWFLGCLGIPSLSNKRGTIDSIYHHSIINNLSWFTDILCDKRLKLNGVRFADSFSCIPMGDFSDFRT